MSESGHDGETSLLQTIIAPQYTESGQPSQQSVFSPCLTEEECHAAFTVHSRLRLADLPESDSGDGAPSQLNFAFRGVTIGAHVVLSLPHVGAVLLLT
jgi:hypothetical protein